MKLILTAIVTLIFVKLFNPSIYEWEVVLYPFLGYMLFASVVYLGWLILPTKEKHD